MTLAFETCTNPVAMCWALGASPGQSTVLSEAGGGERIAPTKDDVRALALDLCKENIARCAEAPELACYNLQTVIALASGKTIQKLCARAVLSTCTANGNQVLRHPEFVVEALRAMGDDGAGSNLLASLLARHGKTAAAAGLCSLATYQRNAKLPEAAQATLKQALAKLPRKSRQESIYIEFMRGSITAQLAEVTTELGREQEAQQLLDATLENDGVREAAFSGHPQAERVYRLVTEQLTIMHLADREDPKLPHEWRRLLVLLNTSPELLVQLAQELENSQAAGISRRPTDQRAPKHDRARTEADDAIFFCQATLTLQDMARQICDDAVEQTGYDTWLFQGLNHRSTCLISMVRAFSSGPLLSMTSPRYSGGHENSTDTMNLELTGCLNDHGGWSQWFVESIQLLISELRSQAHLLRRCRMPRGPIQRLDYLLGEEETDAPDCGMYYFGSASTCGHRTCEKYHGLFGIRNVPFALMNRAREISEREFRRSRRRGIPDDLWMMAREKAGSDPREILVEFRKLLK